MPALPMESLFPATLKLPSDSKAVSPRDRKFSTSSNNGTAFENQLGDYISHSSSRSHQISTLQPTYEIFIDTGVTIQTPHTSFKTTHRPHYTASRDRGIPNPDDLMHEVLLWNDSGLITEGSLTTPYFYRKGKWITPAVELEHHGGQQGTTRRWALERRLCEEGIIEKKSIRDGERVWLSNGVRGFGWGRVGKGKK